MRAWRTIPNAYVATVLVSVALAAARSGQPRRELDVPFVPTTYKGVQAMLKLAGVKKPDVVYDLGCGDGRVVIAAARAYGARGVGIDIDPERISEARQNAKKAGVEKLVRFVELDLFQADIREATVVTLFLLPEVNLKLRPKLLATLKPGTRVVSHTFDMGDWKAGKELTIDTSNEDEPHLSGKFFLWIVPRRAGK